MKKIFLLLIAALIVGGFFAADVFAGVKKAKPKSAVTQQHRSISGAVSSGGQTSEHSSGGSSYRFR